ncbi:hypothetical protein QPK32_25140 [Massilia sp. YIM B02763]|uniref:hypothetical protein n=1 Tax=Massilia sp. YIM B02763 TaxID=3050130 RepID=UPI0025B649BD|nr:hypothetical protein [Massilia sp. YIM B02763]MDN4056357.1 hypothetical protein [Massilia sp. YIM B02763]
MIDGIDLVDVARASGLRGFLHGVNATDARALLGQFVLELERRRGPLVERLVWKDAAELPDVDVTFQLFDPEASEPVWPGYYDGERWVYADGMPATPTHYADMPRGPAPASPFTEHRVLVLERSHMGSLLRTLVLHLDAGGTTPSWRPDLHLSVQGERVTAAMLAAAQPGMPVDPELSRLADEVRALRARWDEEEERLEAAGGRSRRRYG